MNNKYFEPLDGCLEPTSQGKILIQKGQAGELSLQDIPWNPRDYSLDTFMDREHYCRQVSWALLTKEWMDSVVKILPLGCKVLEVCAGRGTLAGPMAARGIDWTCVDQNPPEGCDHVVQMDAEEACRLFKPDVVVAVWIPCGSDLDVRLARQYCCLFVGEGCGGCTGSEGFWESNGFKLKYPPESFKDVPQWTGIHDSTVFTTPQGTAKQFAWDLPVE